MQVGTYADGRPLNCDETSHVFDVGGTPVTPEYVAGYDRAGQVAWLSDELRSWAVGLGTAQAEDEEAGAHDGHIPEPKRGKLFGFRSKRIWKMVVASAYYALCVIATIGVFASIRPYATSTADKVLDVVSYLIVVLIFLSPAFLLSEFGYRDRLPFFKRRKVLWSAAGLAIVLVLLSVTVALAGGLHSQPYKVAAERERIALQKKQDADAAAQRSAEASAAAQAKRAADAKAAAEASAAADAKRAADAKAAAQKATTAAAPASVGHALPAYTIAKVEDISIVNAKRYTYHVVVTQNPTVDDLAKIADKVIEKAKSERPFNAVVIGFYDYPEYIGLGYIFGKVEYSPNGDWASAKTVSTGDYSSMRAVRDLGVRDWSKRLTPEEVKVWRAWQDESLRRDVALGPSDTNGVDEAKLSSDIGKKYGMSATQVDAILKKQMRWQFP